MVEAEQLTADIADAPAEDIAEAQAFAEAGEEGEEGEEAEVAEQAEEARLRLRLSLRLRPRRKQSRRPTTLSLNSRRW